MISIKALLLSGVALPGSRGKNQAESHRLVVSSQSHYDQLRLLRNGHCRQLLYFQSLCKRPSN
jgi:hypothetical protein